MINKQAFLYGYLDTKEKATPYLIKIAANINDIDLGELFNGIKQPNWQRELAQEPYISNIPREVDSNLLSRNLREATTLANKKHNISVPTDVASINTNPGLTGSGSAYVKNFYEKFRPQSIKERLYNYFSRHGKDIQKSIPEFMQPMSERFLRHAKAEDINRYLKGYSPEELAEAGKSRLTQARELNGRQLYDDALQNRNFKNLFKNYFKENTAFYKQYPKLLLKTPLAKYGGGAALGGGAIYGGWKLGESIFGGKPQPQTFADRIRSAIQRIQR